MILTARASFVGDVQMTIWFGKDSEVDDASSELGGLDVIPSSNP